MDTTIAFLIVFVLVGLAVFQLLLIAGRPLGRFAWGGQHKVLPQNLRLGSVLSIGLYALFAMVVLDRAGLLRLGFTVPGWAIWVLAGYFTLGVVMNAISRSPAERKTMTPVALLLAIGCYLLAL